MFSPLFLVQHPYLKGTTCEGLILRYFLWFSRGYPVLSLSTLWILFYFELNIACLWEFFILSRKSLEMEHFHSVCLQKFSTSTSSHHIFQKIYRNRKSKKRGWNEISIQAGLKSSSLSSWLWLELQYHPTIWWMDTQSSHIWKEYPFPGHHFYEFFVYTSKTQKTQRVCGWTWVENFQPFFINDLQIVIQLKPPFLTWFPFNGKFQRYVDMSEVLWPQRWEFFFRAKTQLFWKNILN